MSRCHLRARPLFAWFAWMVPLAVGCETLLDVNSYHASPGHDASTHDASTDVTSPSAEAGPDASLVCGYVRNAGNDCVDCLSGHCGDLSTACDADPTCQAFDECLAGCGFRDDANPGCYLQCQIATRPVTSPLLAGVDYPGWAAAFVQTGCAYSACKVGERWECTKKGWRWPTPPAGTTAHIRVTLLNASGPGAGAFTAKICDGTFPPGCGAAQIVAGPASSDANGTAELTLPLDRVPPPGIGTSPYVEFTKADGSTQLYYPGHPFVGDQSFAVLTLDTDAGKALFSPVPDLDTSKAIVAVVPIFDCTGAANPANARISGPSGSHTLYAPTPSLSTGSAIDLNAPGTFPQAAPTFIANVDPASSVLIRAQAQPQYGDQYIAAVSVEVRGGNSSTMVTLYPMPPQ